FRRYWPADTHFIGKDITRFHTAMWPAMLWAAGEEAPRQVFAHGFVYRKSDETGERVKESKTLGNVTEPMDLITKFSAEAFRCYFMRECPFPADGEFSWQRFAEVYNADLANNLGNLYSRVVKLVSQNHGGHLEGTAGRALGAIANDPDVATTVREGQEHVEACRYHPALQALWLQVLNPANKHVEDTKPWALAKTDKEASKRALYDLAEMLRVVTILLKPFMPRAAQTIYTSFNFPTPWEKVRYEDAASSPE